MRTTFTRLAIAAAVIVPATTAAAQQPSRAAVRLAAARTAPSSGAEVRTVAVYRLVAFHSSGLPSQVVVSDSAGRLVAAYRLRDEARSYPMMIDVSGAGLVLQGETPSGTLTLFLYDPSTPSDGRGRADGHWWQGDREGGLRIE